MGSSHQIDYPGLLSQMPEDTIETCRFLAGFDGGAGDSEGGSVPDALETFFCRTGADSRIDWGFRFPEGAGLPRGYFESVQQRLELIGRIDRPGMEIPVLREEKASGGFMLHCPASEGELLLPYLTRLEHLPEGIALRLIMEVLGFILPLTSTPRVLSNVELEDFRVHACDGVLLAVMFCPALALLREERPLSDYQIARKWTELTARMLVFIRQKARNTFEETLPGDSKSFKGLLKDLEAGREKSLVERIHEIIHLMQRELDQLPGVRKRLEFPITPRELPIGPLADYLRIGFARSHPGKTPSHCENPSPGLCFSPFVIEASSGGEMKDRLGYLLPPEHWFEVSLVDPVNRRLSHPFLKSHHNAVRVRSVYCDEHATVLFGDLSQGLPLPSLLGVFDGVSPDELLVISGKVHRAMEQFESAGFNLHLSSPWQVEIHLESVASGVGWEQLLRVELATWPPWEVKLRVEPPAESFIHGASGISWCFVLKRLSGKFFPALMAWMLDWKRFQDAYRMGNLESEPLNRDGRLDSLFRAAGEHFDTSNPGHRGKFFSLLSEGLGEGKDE